MTAMTTPRPTILRNADLETLATVLRDQHARKVDAVVPATALAYRQGALTVDTDAVQLDTDGVTPIKGVYRPTRVFDDGLARALAMPPAYLRQLRAAGRADLMDANVNGLLHGKQIRRADGTVDVVHPADQRSFLARCYRGGDGQPGVARALLSNGYKIVDDIDVLTAALAGARDAGIRTEVVRCDLTERTMRVTLGAPDLCAQAPELLRGYRSPFEQGAQRVGRDGDVAFWRAVAAREGQGYAPGTEPVVFAGVTVRNSEVGYGAVVLVPELLVQVCRNGLVLNMFAERKVHAGARLDDGVVNYSADTHQKNLDLIQAKTRDTIAHFLTPEFITARVAEIEAKAGAELTAPEKQVKVIGKELGFSEARTDEVLAHFIKGGKLTAGGVLSAITSVAQTIEDGDDAAELQELGMRGLDVAYSVAARR